MMAEYHVKFDDSQASELKSTADILENYEYILKNISKDMETMNITQINLKYQLDQQIKKFPNLMAKLRAEGDALIQIMDDYRKAENNAQNGFQNNSGVNSALASLVNFWSSIIITWTSGGANWVNNSFKNVAKEIDRQLNPEPSAPATDSRAYLGEKLEKMKETYKQGSKWDDTYEGSKQCAGFARLTCNELFGDEVYTNPDAWEINADANSIVVGDTVRYGLVSSNRYDHSIIVTKVDGDMVYYVDCNRDNKNTVNWNGSMTKGELQGLLNRNLNDSGSYNTGKGSTTKGYIRHRIL